MSDRPSDMETTGRLQRTSALVFACALVLALLAWLPFSENIYVSRLTSAIAGCL